VETKAGLPMGANRIGTSRTSLVVFHMQGCPACHEYLPRLRAAARRHPTVPVHVMEAGQNSQLADAFKVSAVPATFVVKGTRSIRREGALPDHEIEWAFRLAEHHA